VGPQYTDLITRYNLHSRLAETPAAASSEGGKGKAPASKQDRQLAHKAKRDDMILAARRQLEAMIAKERAASA
jgi:coupling of ubiquitin conjugation to ER degradation protein 1